MDYDENRNEGNRLRELGGSDFEIKDGQPNIKGWTVKNDNDQTIGEVDELIFDTQARKVRYIVLDLDDNDWDLESRDVLVPIGLAELDNEHDHVILPGITADQIRLLPDYDEDRLTGDTENSIRSAFAGAGVVGVVGNMEQKGVVDDFYNHEHFNEDRLTSRRRSSGGMGVNMPVDQARNTSTDDDMLNDDSSRIDRDDDTDEGYVNPNRNSF